MTDLHARGASLAAAARGPHVSDTLAEAEARREGYARGAAAMREAAAALCEKVADMSDPAREQTRRCMARGIRALPLPAPGEGGERCACDDGALGLGERGA